MRGGSNSLPAQEAEKVTHLPLGVKRDFCSDMMMTSENKKAPVWTNPMQTQKLEFPAS